MLSQFVFPPVLYSDFRFYNFIKNPTFSYDNINTNKIFICPNVRFFTSF